MNKFLLTTLVGATVSSQAFAADLSDKSWDEIVAQAKEEGQVSWFVWYFQPEFREIVKAFEDEYGIKVTIPDGSLDGNINKAMAERKRKKGDIDVLAMGADKYIPVIQADLIEDISFIPNYADGVHLLQGIDTQGKGLAYWGNQTGLAYDPNSIIEADLPQSFAELDAWLKANPKKFAFNDPNGGGSGPSFVRAAVVNFNKDKTEQMTEEFNKNLANWSNTWAWFKENKDNIALTASNADSLTRLNDGEFTLVPAWEDHMASLQKQGAIDSRFKLYIPEFGMSGGGNFSSVMKNAKNPAAALVFLNWLVSADVQSQFNATFGAAPQNKKADDSQSLIPTAQRAYITNVFPTPYEAELKKQIINNIFLGQ
ncbi:MAG: extracellular solute-binding protein [Alphaproteobacteria bacterium]